GGIVPGGVGGTGGGRTASGASSGGAGRGVSGSVAGIRRPGGSGVGRGGVAGGVPMAGTGGGRRDQKKPSSVLSQVERSGNLEKILGPAPLTVPPVIGDWARKTPPDTPQ
ncbi:hypothetical protein M0E87_11375, partial [Corynebacterium sp. CCM 9185]|nr:hypothetical protein [Corynebacterium marambiense]